MKERPKSIYKDLPPIKLYLDDVREIYEILKEHCATVVILTDRYELNDVDTLKNIEVDSLNQLTIQGSNPYVSVEFKEGNAHIYMQEDSITNRGILSKIDDALKRCKRSIARLFVGWQFYAFSLFTVMIANVLIGTFVRGWVMISLIICMVVLYLGLLVYASTLDTKKYSTIVLTERRGEKSFFTRNKDRILVGTITAIVTAILTFVVIKLAESI